MTIPLHTLLMAAGGGGVAVPNPLEILGAMLVAWWDGADPEGDGAPPADTTSVNPWVDKANSHDLTVVGGSQYRSNILVNGHGVMEFDGVDDGYDSTTAFIYALGTAEIWCMFKSDESGDGTLVAEGISTNGSAVYRLYDEDDTNDVNWQLTNTSNVDRFLNSQDRQSSGVYDLVIATDNGAATGTSNEVVDVDAGTTGAYTRDGPAFNRVAVGFTRRITNSLWFDGRIAEILVLTSAADSGERTALATYFNTKWGMSWTPA
jgi:hypothetical protein